MKRKPWAILRLIFWLALFVCGAMMVFNSGNPSLAQEMDSFQKSDETHPIYVLELDDEIISPITAEYIRKGIGEAADAEASLVVLQLDTPGGLLSSTHRIVKDILNADVPVVVYVSPAGARAGSAGVFVTMAGHVAAMDPSSHIGAAHPVDSNGEWPVGHKKLDGKGGSESTPSVAEAKRVMSEKIMNDTVAAIRVLARSRHRNEDWAVRAVTESQSITADEALENNVVDILAPNLKTLLNQLEGRTVDVRGERQVLHLSNEEIVDYEFSTRQQVLGVLTHPLLSYILLMVGFYAIVFEVTHPGFGIPGIAGIICLILAMIGMQAMSINMAGVGLILVGMVMFIAEIFTPTFGMLLAGGIASIVFGTLLLYQTEEPFLREVIPYALSIALIMAGFTAFLLWKVIKVYRKEADDPLDKLVLKSGRVVKVITPEKNGKIRVIGEIWEAECSEPLEKDAKVKVLSIDKERRILTVESLNKKEK